MSDPDIKRRLAEMIRALEEMVGGDLGHELPISPAEDELDAIAYGVNILVGELAFTTERLRQARLEAEAATAVKSTFLRNASHELRTPLTVIVWLAESLKDPSAVPPDRLARTLAAIKSSAQDLLRTTEDVLDLTRLEEQVGEPPLVPVSLLDTIHDAIKTLQPLAERKELQLRAVLEPGAPQSVVTNADDLRRILVNLLANAIKFSAEGEIVVRAESLGSLAAIGVEDPGIGIPVAARDRIFDPFFQVDRTVSRRLGGTGVGLALAKRLAQRLGGDLVLAASEEGVGSTFRLTLPVDLGGDRETAPLPRPEASSIAARPLRGLRVLVADDERAAREALCSVLEAAGATVARASNGEEALAHGLNGRFEMILMDLRMPVLDGLDATARLRAAGYRRPIMALSAGATPEQREACLAAGCDDYLTKPIGAAELVARVDTLRRGSRA